MASVVFFTDRFVDSSRAWFGEVRADRGLARRLAAVVQLAAGAGQPLRCLALAVRQRGAVGHRPPCAVDVDASLGPVPVADGRRRWGNLVTLVIAHASGATCTASLTVFAPPAAAGFEAALWGDGGRGPPMPSRPERAPCQTCWPRAAQELVEAVHSGWPHELDLGFGARVVELLASARHSSRPPVAPDLPDDELREALVSPRLLGFSRDRAEPGHRAGLRAPRRHVAGRVRPLRPRLRPPHRHARRRGGRWLHPAGPRRRRARWRCSSAESVLPDADGPAGLRTSCASVVPTARRVVAAHWERFLTDAAALRPAWPRASTTPTC